MKKIILLISLFTLATVSLVAQYNRRYIYYKGQNAIANKEYYQAINLLSLLIESDTLSQEAYFLRAVAKYNINDIVGAEDDFSNAINVNPVYVEAFQYRAITRSVMGNYNDALNDYKKAIEIRPDFYNTYYSRGVTLYLNQQFEDAISDFDIYIEKDPQATDALINRGTSYLMIKDTTKALENYDKAIEASPRYTDAYMRRGGLLSSLGRNSEAIKDLDRAILYDGKNLGAYFNRAIAYANDNKPISAIEDFTHIIYKDSTNSLTYFNRAILRSQIGDYNHALEDYDKVIDFAPTNVLGYYNRGGLHSKLGNLEEAFEDFSTAIRLYPDFANAYLNRSNIRYLLGDKEGAGVDNEIAKSKISEYNRRTVHKEQLDKYSDTSKILNNLLSFDNKEFRATKDGVKNKDYDIPLLAMFKIMATESSTRTAWIYSNKDLASLRKDLGVSNLGISNKSTQLVFDLNKRASKQHKPWSVSFIQGMNEYSLKQYTNAINLYNRAIDDNPNNAFLYFNRSSAKTEMIEFISNIENREQRLIIGADKVKTLNRTKMAYDYDEAMSDINYAIKINPHIAHFYYNKANILCKEGEMPKAIKEYTKAIQIDNSFAEAYYNRGLIQVYLKDTKKGWLDISRAGELGLEEAYKKLKETFKVD